MHTLQMYVSVSVCLCVNDPAGRGRSDPPRDDDATGRVAAIEGAVDDEPVAGHYQQTTRVVCVGAHRRRCNTQTSE